MRPGRILVTGASGFVGRHLLAELEARFPDATRIAADTGVTDGAAVRDMVAEARPDAVVHLAGIASVPAARADPAAAFAINLGGTLNLARALLAEVPGALLVHAGSADSYGASFRTGVALDETAPLAPLNAYAAKAAADLALGAMIAEDGLRAARFRAFNHTGPGQSDAFALPAFAAQLGRIRAGRQPPIIRVGNLDAERDFLDVRDVVRAYALAIGHADGLARDAVFNLASGEARRIGDVLDAMIAMSGLSVTTEIDPDRVRPVDIARTTGDATAAARRLGWRPEIRFTDTLRDLLESAGAIVRSGS
jgi:GDP-4-dehydro-6-deoxy-D-mannose reductase